MGKVILVLVVLSCVLWSPAALATTEVDAKITYYWIVSEPQLFKSTDVMVPLCVGEPLWDSSGNYTGFDVQMIFETSQKFFQSLATEGTGILNVWRGRGIYGGRANGQKLVNISEPCDPNMCQNGTCFVELDKKYFPFGMGSDDNALIPWRSAAADPAFIEPGTWIYSPAHDGVKINMKANQSMFRYITNPKYMGLDEFELFPIGSEQYVITHDGCFRVDDTGVTGKQIDIFAGKSNLYSQVKKITGGKIVIGDPKCGEVVDTDADDDGVADDVDNCPEIYNDDQQDADGDGIGDKCEPDTDKDGIIDDKDNCRDVINPDQADADADGIGDLCDDADSDGILDINDNCPFVYNVYQEDKDSDGVGDLCESDSDGDGVVDDYDNCKTVSNADQLDADADGVGNLCEPDSDLDAVIDDVDNCFDVPNPDQLDADKDGTGDACEPDSDGDGIIDDNDNCVSVANANQNDTDKDGSGDLCDLDADNDGVANAEDNCPLTVNEAQMDTDMDGYGDACDSDMDGDGILNESDNCPLVMNADQTDRDSDGLGDACETDVDSDGDEYYDNMDNCPDLYNPDQLDLNGDGIGYRCDGDKDVYYKYCGDEEVFGWEDQAPISVSVELPVNHGLLPPIKVDIPDNLNSATIVGQALIVKAGSEISGVTAEVVNESNNIKLVLKNGLNGKRAWYPNAVYTIKLCHQIKTSNGLPIEPLTITVTTRPPNQQENIGISHSGGSRSGVFYLPRDFDPKKVYPMAVLLHGLGGRGADMVSAFQSLSDQMGVILVGPDGYLRTDPFNTSGKTYYFNPNYKSKPAEDFTFIQTSVDRMHEAFSVNGQKVLVAGMSMGAPATLFVATNIAKATHGAMMHGVRWNFDRGSANDVANFLWYDWEITPVGAHKVPFWYSTSVDDWVTNYTSMSVPSFMKDDVGYLRSSGLSVVEKKNYTGGHTMSAQEKQDVFNWFILGTLPK